MKRLEFEDLKGLLNVDQNELNWVRPEIHRLEEKLKRSQGQKRVGVVVDLRCRIDELRFKENRLSNEISEIRSKMRQLKV